MEQTPPLAVGGFGGLYFEQFQVGMCIETASRTITEADLVNFAGISGDFTALHTDEESSKKGPFRRRIAHGMLIQSIATGLAIQTRVFEGTIAALVSMDIRWLNPIYPGDTITLLLDVTEVDPVPSKRSGKITLNSRVVNQDGVVCVGGTWGTLLLCERAAKTARRRSARQGGEAS
ncbi:MAG: dehydratase [Planctomycetes bacterium]|jgi:acyl dehydratase|nr:dehydratase [Planctomycetota bacterium]